MSSESREEPIHISEKATILWYQTILNRYNSINSANTSIDTKSGIILAAAVAVLIFTVQSIEIFSYLSTFGMFGLAITVAVGVRGMHIKNIATEVHTTSEKESYYSKDDETFLWQLIADLEDSLSKIDIVNQSKARWYAWAVYLFVGSSALVAIGQFIDVYIKTIGQTV